MSYEKSKRIPSNLFYYFAYYISNNSILTLALHLLNTRGLSSPYQNKQTNGKY